MTLITASSHAAAAAAKLWSKNIQEELDSQFLNMMTKPTSTNMNDYEIRRLGYKDYGVFRVGTLRARYKCSHLEARRRWAMVLVTKRLCS